MTSRINGPTFCQTCGDVEVVEFLSLGLQPAFNFPVDAQEAEAEPLWPLDLGFCERCGLVQVMEAVSERLLFTGEYHHLAGLTAGYRQHLGELADVLAAQLEQPSRAPSVVEIGSNDGTLLGYLAQRGFDATGVDPVGQLPEGAQLVKDYFSSKVAKRIADSRGPVDAVVSLNTFAHVTDLHDVIDGVCTILGPDGMFVTESHYLLGLLDDMQYDFAYHEHSRYYSLTALDAVFAMHGLEVFHVDHIPTHGGSIRVYAGFVGAHEVDGSVADLRRKEEGYRLTDKATYDAFAVRVQEHRDALREEVKRLTGDGSRLVGASAAGRAITLLNYCDLGPSDIEYISEISPRKIGKIFPGVHIPIVPQSELTGPDQPEYALLLSWHIADEIMPRLRAEGFRGKFVVPVPEPRVID